jgi:hypothetical protein
MSNKRIKDIYTKQISPHQGSACINYNADKEQKQCYTIDYYTIDKKGLRIRAYSHNIQ